MAFNARSSQFALAFTLALGALVACSPAKWRETENMTPAPFTADPHTERQTTPHQAGDFNNGDKGYVRPGRICARKTPDETCEQTDTIIEQNDEITVVDPTPKGDQGLIEVEVTDKDKPDAPLGPIYIPPQYISKEPVSPPREEADADRYFVVQNIATEKLRVYENCGGRSCAHRLVLETDMVVGQNEKHRRSLLGSYRITKWFKFYEDYDNEYPSWFNPTYPAIPRAGADLKDWTKKDLLPRSSASVRGAFGWYTAFIGPNADEQWTHGTWGWGADGDKFIQALRSSPLDQNSLLASHGCSRVENQAIAYMREILPPGTKLIKIYAREAKLKDVVGKQTQWPWTLTKSDVDKENGSSAHPSFTEDESEVLESGVYNVNSQPTVVALTVGGDPHRNGNSYEIPLSSFQGRFLIDQGRLEDYRHPKNLEVGGHADKTLPSVVLMKKQKSN